MTSASPADWPQDDASRALNAGSLPVSRQGPVIGRAWPVRPAARPWRGARGITLSEAVSGWMRLNKDRFPPPEQAGSVIRSGEFCGSRAPEQSGRPACLLVTQSAIVACLAELGLAAATRAELHHNLAELVDARHLAPRVQVLQLPGLGDTWFYAFNYEFAS